MTRDGLQLLLQDVVGLLSAIGIPHMVVGSFASMVHGEPRTTQDLDVVIDPTAEQLEQLLQRLPADRYYVDPDVARDARRRRSMFNVIDMASGWKMDLIVRKARPFSVEELQRRAKATMQGVVVDTATAEDTIIAKLEWSKAGSSERQLEDIAGILRVRGDKLDRAYIERWVDELELREQWDRAQRL
ncbi:MAG TPA: hypothetical protein VFV99_12050 [Kofleriaceae bacterium]|nr:hypothetical protein [Kofleriaceae bacterium]